MMLMTIINSIKVNPRLRPVLSLLAIYQSLYFVPSSAVSVDLV
jgi:hypothetical protein